MTSRSCLPDPLLESNPEDQLRISCGYYLTTLKIPVGESGLEVGTGRLVQDGGVGTWLAVVGSGYGNERCGMGIGRGKWNVHKNES